MEIDIEQIFGITNIRKTAGTDDLSDRFLKDGSRFLSKPVTELYSLSVRFL